MVLLRLLPKIKLINPSRNIHRCLRDLETVKLNYTKLGKEHGSNKPIVIHHGMLGSSKNWFSLARMMQKQVSRPIYIIDARNHGGSPSGKSLTYFDFAADLRQFIVEHNLQEATLLGHSLGARTVMLLALLEPDFVDSLLVVDAIPLMPASKAGIRMSSRFIEALAAVNLQDLDSKLTFYEAKIKASKILEENGVERESMRDWLLMNLEKDKITGNFEWTFKVELFQEYFEPHLTTVPAKNEWKNFHGKTGILGGAKSGYIPKDSHPEIKKLFPNAEIDYVSNAGHWVQVDNPREFLAKSIRFLKISDCT